MDPLSQVFCLKWNNHQNNLLTVLDHLYQTEAFCDVTLACDNTSIKCHKMILSACSSYFQTLFMENTCEHPIVFLKDIKIGEVRAILDYMYKGEVNVAQEELPGLLKVAELLRVKGLVEGESDKLLNSNYAKNGRPLVTTSMSEPQSSSKVNGNEPENRSRTISSDRTTNQERERDPSNGPKESPLRPFMPGTMPMHMFPGMPGLFPNLLGAREAQQIRSNEESERDGSPSPGSGNKRRKVASGSGGSCSSKESGGLGHDNSANLDVGRGEREDKGLHHELDKEGMMGMPPGLDKSGIANYVPSQRLEWKRYKQYTRNDIMSAIEEVKNGMSALQASRKYGVPSRTLYDKVKKMGITTGRQVQKKSLPNYPSQFPGFSGMMGMNDMDDRDDTNDSSLGTPGDDSRATMVPPTSLSTYMLNIMKGMQPDHSGKDSEVSLTPMNLSTMLKSSQSSPSKSRDLEHDEVDSTAGRGRHSSGHSPTTPGEPNSADIKSQFLADFRRLAENRREQQQSEPASSTTHSPPAPATPTQDENNLPPRKRKVSQEHQLENQRSPYNGIHEQSQQDSAVEKVEENTVDCR